MRKSLLLPMRLTLRNNELVKQNNASLHRYIKYEECVICITNICNLPRHIAVSLSTDDKKFRTMIQEPQKESNPRRYLIEVSLANRLN